MEDNKKILEYIWDNKTFQIKAVHEFHEILQNDHSYARQYFENLTQNDDKHIDDPVIYDSKNSSPYNSSNDEMYVSQGEVLDEETKYQDENIKNFENVEEDTTMKTWTVPATKLLLEEYKKRVKHFRNPKMKKSLLWQEIEVILKGKNHNFDSSKIQGKFRNMKHTYEKIKKRNSKRTTSTGRQSWLYLNEMDEIFHDDKSINFSSNEKVLNMVDDNSTHMTLSCSNESLNSVEGTDDIVRETNMSNDSNLELNTANASSSSKSGQSSRLTKLCYDKQKQFDRDNTMLGILKNLGEKIDLTRKVREKNALLQAQKTSELIDAINAGTEVLRNISNHLIMLLNGVKKRGDS